MMLKLRFEFILPINQYLFFQFQGIEIKLHSGYGFIAVGGLVSTIASCHSTILYRFEKNSLCRCIYIKIIWNEFINDHLPSTLGSWRNYICQPYLCLLCRCTCRLRLTRSSIMAIFQQSLADLWSFMSTLLCNCSTAN